MKTFSEYAKERIKHLGKSQKALAKKLDVSPAYVSQIFTGKKNPPDLGRRKNREQLKIWSAFLDAGEEDILDLIRFQLHRVPPRPSPRYREMRTLLLSCLGPRERGLPDEIRAMEFHPAENMAIQTMIQIYLILGDEFLEERAFGLERFRELVSRARASRELIEGDLIEFFRSRPFSWAWDAEANHVRFYAESEDVQRAMRRLMALGGNSPSFIPRRTVPLVGHVSAGEGFTYTDGGYPVGEGFEQIDIPPGVDPRMAERLYCVRVRGESLREFINEGAVLFIKPESWEEIRDGDLVIFKDRRENRAFVKKVEFSGSSLILKSMNPMYKNIVMSKSDLVLLERVLSVVF